MIGVVVVCHGRLAEELLGATRNIVGEFPAAEAVSVRYGQRCPTAERPWTVAFAFGLLHGFGFAGALTQTGLPADAIPLALLFFNIGVELGQLAFVAAVLAAIAAIRRLSPPLLLRATGATAYGIGILAAFWTINRVIDILV